MNSGDSRKNQIKKKPAKTAKTVETEKTVEAVKTEDAGRTCAVAGLCGGCGYSGVPYDTQLKKKQDYIEGLLSPFGKVLPIIGMEDPFYYRNKVNAAFGAGKNGSVICGTYQEGTHKIISHTNCFIEDRKAAEIIADICLLAQSFGIPIYNEDTGRGVLRHVMVRTGRRSGQILVVLVVGTTMFPSRKNFVRALCRKHPQITTVVQNLNPGKTSMVLGRQETVLWGKGYIEDSLLGRSFRISSRSFFQVNPIQTEKLYQTAVDFAGLTGRERIIDAYCGTGTIGLICADKAGEVIGIESNKDAVSDARINARNNHIDNIRFICDDAADCMLKMSGVGERVDIILMDPPRTGSTEVFLKSAAKMKPQKIVYVSCGPETLARDLKILEKLGYHLVQAQPVDMFPMTYHVETVVLLSRKDS